MRRASSSCGKRQKVDTVSYFMIMSATHLTEPYEAFTDATLPWTTRVFYAHRETTHHGQSQGYTALRYADRSAILSCYRCLPSLEFPLQSPRHNLQGGNVIAINGETRHHRFFLAALNDGTVAFYDRAQLGHLLWWDKEQMDCECLRDSPRHWSPENPVAPVAVAPFRESNFIVARQPRSHLRSVQNRTAAPERLPRPRFADTTSPIGQIPSSGTHQRQQAQNPFLKHCCWVPNDAGGLLTANSHHVVEVWDIEKHLFSTRKSSANCFPLVSVRLHGEGETTGFFSPAGSRRDSHSANELHNASSVSKVWQQELVACCGSSSIQLIDLRIAQVVTHLFSSAEEKPTVLRWHPTNAFVFVNGTSLGSVHCWDIRRAGGTCVFSCTKEKMDTTFDVGRRQKRLATLRRAVARRRVTPTPALTLKPPPRQPITPALTHITDLQFVAAGRYILSTSNVLPRDTQSQGMQLWNAFDGHFCSVYYAPPSVLHQRNAQRFPIPSRLDILDVGKEKEIALCALQDTVAAYDVFSGTLLHSSRSFDTAYISSIYGYATLNQSLSFLSPYRPGGLLFLTGSTKGKLCAWGIDHSTLCDSVENNSGCSHESEEGRSHNVQHLCEQSL